MIEQECIRGLDFLNRPITGIGNPLIGGAEQFDLGSVFFYLFQRAVRRTIIHDDDLEIAVLRHSTENRFAHEWPSVMARYNNRYLGRVILHDSILPRAILCSNRFQMSELISKYQLACF